MTTKEANAILAACKDRSELKAALHDHFDFSVDAARTLVMKWFPTSAKDANANGQTSRADVARVFRSARQKQEARMGDLYFKVYQDAHAGWLAGQGPAGWGDVGQRKTIATRIAGELAADLGTCKTRDELEAKLVRLEWDDDVIADYLDKYE